MKINPSSQIIPFEGKLPKLGDDIFLASGSKIIGNVSIGSKTSIWYNCVIRGDVNYIKIGDNTNIQDGTVIHVSSNGFSATGGVGAPTNIGNNVTIGHNATIHACTIKNFSLIGMGATILDSAIINEMAFVAAGSLIPPRAIIGSEELWAGNPGKFMRKINEREKELIRNTPEVYSALREKFLKK